MQEQGLIDEWVEEISKAPDAVIDRLVVYIRSSLKSNPVPADD